MANLSAPEYVEFEESKNLDENGSEFWYARELQVVLQYNEWRNFSKVIDKAKLSCKNSGFTIGDHFVEVNKTIDMPKQATKQIVDYMLTRYACYLIVQNGDPRKEIIALGQTYFAIQTRRQEVADYFNQLDEENKRLVIRGDIKQWNQMLAEAAHNAGVITKTVRKAIEDIGGTMPEDLPTPVKGITQLEREQLKKLKSSKKKLMLDE